MPSELIPLKEDLIPFLNPYIPNKKVPFVTLTYAQSLDSMISAGKGVQTAISHLETKTMTHYLRSKHDGILVGVGTVIADDPGLNCRYKGEEERFKVSTPRPIVLDPSFRWTPNENSRVIETAKSGEGLGPYVLVGRGVREKNLEKVAVIKSVGGMVVELGTDSTSNSLSHFDWNDVFNQLRELGVKSVMVEGGATIINSLLQQPSLVDSVIITIGPVFLGNKGVHVSPTSHVQLKDVTWWHGIQDSVLAGRL